jgi:hypothetical protein
MIFNTVKPLSIISEGTAKDNRCGKTIGLLGENYFDYHHYRTDFSFELQIIKVFEITR